MDINYILLWIVALSCGSTLLRGMRGAGISKAWKRKAVLILGIAGLGLEFYPKTAGLVSGALWLLVFVLPVQLLRLTAQLISKEQFASARVLCYVCALLHPYDAWPTFPIAARALGIEDDGAKREALVSLESSGATAISFGRFLYVQIASQAGMWEEILGWLQNEIDVTIIRTEPALGLAYVRAWCELGQLDAAIQSVYTLGFREGSLEGSIVRVYLAAFTGLSNYLTELFAKENLPFSAEQKQLWLATAIQAEGKYSVAKEMLESLQKSDSARIRSRAQLRMKTPAANLQGSLSRESAEYLQSILSKKKSRQHGIRGFNTDIPTPVTKSLMAMNVLVYLVLLVIRGSTDPRILFAAGALLPSAVIILGQWWRIFTAIFLHFGFAHLFMNLFGLYILGPFVERTLGMRRFLVLYLLSGVGSMLTIVLLTFFGLQGDNLVLGASGAIMGLVGATGAIYYDYWVRFRAPFAYRQLKAVGVIVLIQVVFDLSTPQVSFTAHFSGVVIGVLVGMLLLGGKRESHVDSR